MKPSEVYLRAAELIDSGHIWTAYRQLRYEGGGIAIDRFNQLFCLWWELESTTNDSAALALCLMSAIAAYDETHK